MSIFNHFPYDQPRPGQRQVLEWIERNWNNYDVFVLQAPVAAGKSGLAFTIANWANHQKGVTSNITTPDNVLVRQYKKDFKLPTLKRRNQFASGPAFDDARDKFRNEPIKLMNNFTLLANRVYSNVQIMDEAHQLIPMLQDFEGIKVWKHLDYYPDNLRTVADVLIWAASQGDAGKKIAKQLSRNPLDYTIVHEVAPYHGKERECLRIYPLTPKNNKPILWPPSKVHKLILMSATVAEPDIVDLGLHNRRVGYIEVPSDIPKENRPFFFTPVANMGRGRKDDDLAACVDYLDSLHAKYGERGFVHATYKLARSLKEKYPDKFVYHNAADKDKVLPEWLSNKEDTRTFIGCGLTTGLDLKGKICRWQAILKVQFPDLGDPAVMAKSTNNPEWYQWETIKQLVQAYGRVCRSPEDKGDTYCLDKDFLFVYNRYRHLFPGWFKEAFTII